MTEEVKNNNENTPVANEDAAKAAVRALNVRIQAVIADIQVWHKETFPDATMAGQLAKLEEELVEMGEAKDAPERAKELVDVFIVLCGLRRWGSCIGEVMMATMFRMDYDNMVKFMDMVDEKMKVNRARKWKRMDGNNVDGAYHHED